VPQSCGLLGLGDEILVLNPASGDGLEHTRETARVVVLAVVEAVRLLVQVAEQVKRFALTYVPLIARFSRDQ
jgi:hypothetical protein